MLNTFISQPDGNEPLFRYPLFHTKDLEEARGQVSSIFCPHDLKITQGRQLDACMYHVPIGGVSLNRLRYGATVAIDPGCLKDFLLLMMPLSGTADINCGNQSIRSTPDLASVVTPTLPLRMTSHAGCDQVMVRIERSLLERSCAQHLGHELRRPIEFQLGMDMSRKDCESWQALIAFLVSELNREMTPLRSPLARAQVEHMVVTTLLLIQPHNFRDELLRPGPPIAPHYVKRVEEYIIAHADQPLTVGELAAHAGVSTSALFAGFREFRNTSPMAYLRSVRLQRAHDDLLAAAPCSETVTNIAMRWGFTHFGHFTANYKRKFGESPAETLRR